MRVPSFHHRPAWQRFIAGFILGTVAGWVLFILMFGLAQETQMETIREQQAEVDNLKDEIQNLQKDDEEKNERLQNQLTIQKIEVKFPNKDESQLGNSEFSKVEGRVKEQLSSLLNQNIETVAANKDLINLIENETYTIEKEQYRVNILSVVIYSTVEISLELENAKFHNDKHSSSISLNFCDNIPKSLQNGRKLYKI